ncbi:unnamed protein product [Sympodiomycopsis kandeliae]
MITEDIMTHSKECSAFLGRIFVPSIALLLFFTTFVTANPTNITTRDDPLVVSFFSDTRCKDKLYDLKRSEYDNSKIGKCFNVPVDARSVFLYKDGAFFYNPDCKIKALSHAVNYCNWWDDGHLIESISFDVKWYTDLTASDEKERQQKKGGKKEGFHSLGTEQTTDRHVLPDTRLASMQGGMLLAREEERNYETKGVESATESFGAETDWLSVRYLNSHHVPRIK